ncbi:unnamed protein product [Rotaria sordida]|uniref:Uncharacterized protein n=2 Tax=Rotaria sordida TaxID=392033 RepID=A0A814TSG2_9BILA|nr:unnamed protein product [Rotaria sordida]
MIQNDKTAIDVIRAVRSKLSRIPVLIFTNKLDEIQAALEFPNVIATDKEFEVKEFVGVKQETQWNAGCRTSYIQTIRNRQNMKNKKSSLISSTLPYPLEDNLPNTNESGLPPLPIFSSFQVPSRASSLTNSLTPNTSKTSLLKPLLLWIDIPHNDPQTTKEIQESHPTLEIIFKRTYKEAEEYLNMNLREIQERKKFITICRGYYIQEKKGFTDVAKLFEDLNIVTRPLGVYTRCKIDLLERTPDPPKNVEIFDEQSDLLAFVNNYLKAKS